jgi:uncharacterized protein YecE (DUF72 family)
MSKIFLGTSGYSYSDWNGIFYPAGLDRKDQLEFYSSYFNTVEINFTYYTIPNRRIFDNMASRVPDDFIFSVKGHKSMTHTRDCSRDDWRSYLDALSPLLDSKKLGPVLMQFPWAFKFSEGNLKYLEMIKGYSAGIDICVEFRNSSWMRKEVFDFIKGLDIIFCNVDEPRLKTLLPPTDINTASSGYIRFHGRNSANWWKPGQAYQRYDYMYSQEELAEWMPRIKKLSSNTKSTFIYFNNHYKAKAVKSARMLQNLFKD